MTGCRAAPIPGAAAANAMPARIGAARRTTA